MNSTSPPSGFRRAVVLASSLLLGTVLLVSAQSHLSNGYQLLSHIHDYRLIPAWVAVVVAAVLPHAQLTLGVALIFLPAARRAALGLSVGLFAMFVAVQTSALRRGLDISCGCFGESDVRIGWKSLTIAGTGLAVALVALACCRPRPSVQPIEPRRSAFTLIEVLVVIAIIGVILGLLLAAVQKTRAAVARADCQNRVKQLGLALHSYQATRGTFPPGLSVQDDGGKKPYLGWPSYLLPYVEQDAVWRDVEAAFASDPAPLTFYGHPPHAKLLGTPIRALQCPADWRLPGPVQFSTGPVAHTSYLGVEGLNQFARGGVLYLDSRARIADITDGTSQTLAIGERPPSSDFRLGWWYRGWGQEKEGSAEMLLGAREFNETRPQCPPGPFPYGPGKTDNLCDAFHFWSLHSGGANFAFADGSVRFLRYEADAILPALSTRAGGETVVLPD